MRKACCDFAVSTSSHVGLPHRKRNMQDIHPNLYQPNGFRIGQELRRVE
jgi:hypothetical protein